MPTIRDALDAGAAIRAARRSRGLTQAQLARHADVGRQWLVELEGGHPRAELGKVLAVMHALGLTTAVTEADTPPTAPGDSPTRAGRTWLTARDTAEAIRAELRRGDTDFALRILARALADLHALDTPADRTAFLAGPPSTGDHRWDALLAAAVARACRHLDLPAPAWTRTPALAVWWFPVFDPVLAARTMQRTPPDFAARGIWLDATALEVV